MIKLHNSLPNTITVGGREFFVKTDFRYWLLFDEIVSKGKFQLGEVAFIFEDEVPKCNYINELMEFFNNPNSTPRKTKGGSTRVLDFQEDGEYIYASFMSAYGIDLLDEELLMHWHQFKALVMGLPKGTIMSEIMSIRGWKKSKDKIDKMYEDQKRAWALPESKTNREEEEELEEQLAEIFYNA